MYYNNNFYKHVNLYKNTIVSKQNDILYLMKLTDSEEREREREIQTDLKANIVIKI